MSLSEVIESIEREMFDRVTREKNTEMVDITTLENDTDNRRRYTKGRRDCENDIYNVF